MGCDRHTHVDARSRLPRCVLKNADSGSVFSLRIRDEAVPALTRLTEELEAEIVERQAEASERRIVLTRTLPRLADERGKLCGPSTRTRPRTIS
jgi:hypothetical protein